MRAMMGIGKRDALPAPTDDNTGPEGVEYARPKWHLQIKNPINKRVGPLQSFRAPFLWL